MGEIYDIGLQAGSEIAKEIDGFIKSEYKNEFENFDPYKVRTMPDGSKLYRWSRKWNPYRYSDEKRLIAILRQFDHTDNGESRSDEEEIDLAYKLVAMGDGGGFDERGNGYGYKYFEELRLPTSVDCPGDEEPGYYGPYYDVVLARKHAGVLMYKTEAKRLLDMVSGYMVCPVRCFPLTQDTCLMGFASSEAIEKMCGAGRTQVETLSLIRSHLQGMSEEGPGPWTLDIDGTSVYVSAENDYFNGKTVSIGGQAVTMSKEDPKFDMQAYQYVSQMGQGDNQTVMPESGPTGPAAQKGL